MLSISNAKLFNLVIDVELFMVFKMSVWISCGIDLSCFFFNATFIPCDNNLN